MQIALTGKAKAHFRFLEKGITGKACEAKGRAALDKPWSKKRAPGRIGGRF